MKKTTALLAVFVLLFQITISCYAEDVFKLRNGVQFGDSIDDILQKETLKTYVNEEMTMVSTATTQLAGIEESCINYWFLKDQKLNLVVYIFGPYKPKDNTDDEALIYGRVFLTDYPSIEKALTEKYGDALNENDEYYSIKPSLYTTYKMLYLIGILSSSKKTQFKDDLLNSRIVNVNEGIVKIDHFAIQFGSAFIIHSITYEFYTEQEIKEIIQNNKKNAVDDSVLDDI